jgi:hypothetical protein
MPTSFQRKRVAKATYSFATDGGAQTTITPSITTIVPLGAIVTGVFVDCTTNLAPAATTTIAINAGGTTLVTAATATAHGLNTGTVKKSLALAGSATAIKTTASGAVTLTLAVADLSTGVLNIYVEYLV